MTVGCRGVCGNVSVYGCGDDDRGGGICRCSEGGCDGDICNEVWAMVVVGVVAVTGYGKRDGSGGDCSWGRDEWKW